MYHSLLKLQVISVNMARFLLKVYKIQKYKIDLLLSTNGILWRYGARAALIWFRQMQNMKYPEIRDSDTRSMCQSYMPLYPVSAIIPKTCLTQNKHSPRSISANSKLKIFSQRLTSINFNKIYIYTHTHNMVYGQGL